MLRVEVTVAHRNRMVTAKTVVGYVKKVLKAEKVADALVSVVFVGSRYCRKINRQYLKHDYTTDVLAFPLEAGRVLDGEIYVNLDRARVQAREYGVSIGNEIARLVIHGTLHLVGYDDTSSRKAQAMKIEEERHLSYWFK